MNKSVLDNISFDVYISSIDGTPVIHIDTANLPENKNGPVLRVYINDDTDDPVFNNPANHEVK